VLADFSALSALPDDEFAFWLTKQLGVAPVPGSSSFYSRPELGGKLVRFAFCRRTRCAAAAGGSGRAARSGLER